MKKNSLGTVVRDSEQVEESEDFLSIFEFGYTGIKERVYKRDHEEVIKWIDFFNERFRKKKIFETFEGKHPLPDFTKAQVVGSLWYQFSDFMPWFLSQATANADSNEVRHYIIQTAFEELGMRDVHEIHPEMFWGVVKASGVSDADRARLGRNHGIKQVLAFLKTSLLECKTQSEILGMVLGLEMPAQENIESIFYSVAHSKEVEAMLTESKFFKLHRQLEEEHIRLAISNFLRFCPSQVEKQEFIKGYDLGITFWEMFWENASKTIESEKRNAIDQ